MIFIRTDANAEIATGHMMRCMSVAKELTARGQRIKFLVSDEVSLTLLNQSSFEYIILYTDWNDLDNQKEIDRTICLLEKSYEEEYRMPFLLVDSYYVSNIYFNKLKAYAKLAMFDDLCNDIYNVDYLINYNITHEIFAYEDIYKNRNTQLLLGPQYIPLREQFLEYVNKYTVKTNLSDDVINVLLICGGGDLLNILAEILEEVSKEESFRDYCFHVVAGVYNPNIDNLIILEEKFQNIRLYYNVKEMAKLMAECDVAVTAASTVLYECCAIGLPTIFFVIAANQENDVQAFTKCGTMLYAGDVRQKREESINCIIKYLYELTRNESLRVQMSNQMRDIVDGKGAERIADRICRANEIGSFYEDVILPCEKIKNSIWEWIAGIAANRCMAFFVDGRDAIEAAICNIENRRNINRKVCVLPQYTCDTVILPFQKHGWEIYYYLIQEDMTVDVHRFARLLEKIRPTVLLTHTYYGVDTIAGLRYLIQYYRETNNLIYIEDMTQSLFMLEEVIGMTDYVVGSLRKWVAIPDGAFCISTEEIDAYEYEEYDEFVQIKREAQHKKKLYLMGELNDKEEYLYLNSKAEDMLYKIPQICRMSDESISILKKIKKDLICQKRNENMLILDESIQTIENVKPLVHFAKKSVPLYYPIFVKNQKQVQKIMKKHNIYVPILWNIPEMIKDIDITVKSIYKGMLAIPCDQRYDIRDMRNIIGILKKRQGS